jgi:hypothetical protein
MLVQLKLLLLLQVLHLQPLVLLQLILLLLEEMADIWALLLQLLYLQLQGRRNRFVVGIIFGVVLAGAFNVKHRGCL